MTPLSIVDDGFTANATKPQQLLGTARLAPQHQPAETHLRINRQNELWQLHGVDALLELVSQRRHLLSFFFGRQGCEVKLVVYVQLSPAR